MNFNFPSLPWYIWLVLLLTILVISFTIWFKIFFTKEKQTKIAIQKVHKYFRFLFERGFKMQQADYFPEGNGAWTIILESKECKIRVNQDRGDIYFEVAPIWADNKKYQGLSSIIAQFENNYQNIYYRQKRRNIDSQLEFYAQLLNSYYNQVITRMIGYPKPPY